jgi:hypothetical protein
VNCDGLERLNTLANIMAACIQSSGPSSASCTTLFASTGTPAGGTTLEAAHSMVVNPTANVAALFGLQTATSPFQPTLSSAPDGFELALNFSPTGAKFQRSYRGGDRRLRQRLGAERKRQYDGRVYRGGAAGVDAPGGLSQEDSGSGGLPAVKASIA